QHRSHVLERERRVLGVEPEPVEPDARQDLGHGGTVDGDGCTQANLARRKIALQTIGFAKPRGVHAPTSPLGFFVLAGPEYGRLTTWPAGLLTRFALAPMLRALNRGGGGDGMTTERGRESGRGGGAPKSLE